MPNQAKTPSQPFVGFRVSKQLKRRVMNAQSKAGLSESEIGRLALEQFFQNHPTCEAQIAAVIRHRAKERSGS